MKNINMTIILADISILTMLASCKDNIITPRPAPVNLIQNSSFEINGARTFQSWWRHDTLSARIIQDAPPGGGQWSLLIVPGWYPQQFVAVTFVSGQSGTGVYELTLAMKTTLVGDVMKPKARLGRYTGDHWTNYKTVTTTSKSWTTVSVVDTMTLEPKDTIGVQLSGGGGAVVWGDTRFDLIELKRIQ